MDTGNFSTGAGAVEREVKGARTFLSARRGFGPLKPCHRIFTEYSLASSVR